MRRIIILIILIICFVSSHPIFGQIINPENPQQGWKNNRAYRPLPILFLHGFGPGSPKTWKEARVDESLNKYYSKYYSGYAADPTVLPSTRYPYLELIDFGPDLVDRNSSIDTYKSGDRYVEVQKRKPLDPGWSDKLNTAVETLRQTYITQDGSRQKVILIAHSMGGLAARKYLKSYTNANQEIDKLIIIGTPNLGSTLAAASSYQRNRRWGWHLTPNAWVYLATTVIVDDLLQSALLIDTTGDAVWDMDPTFRGSGFIPELNTNYLQRVNHFVIAGRHWLGFNIGDGIVSLDSQLGTGVLSLQDKVIIDATHWTEPKLSKESILRFLDSATPELEITFPEPNTIIETGENFIRLQGKIYKEYLPADSKLIVNITKQEGNSVLRPQTSLLKASDLWIPNNPDSPVAEIDEKIYFPGPGTYSVSCKVENPAGTYSNEVNIQIKVSNAGPIIAEMHPTGIINDTNPVIYARILSPAGLAIDLNSIKILLDDTVVAHNVNPKENNLETEVSYIPSEGLKRTFHTVSISAADISGKTNNRTWSFEIAAIPEFLSSGEVISSVKKSHLGHRTWSFDTVNFREELLKVRDLTISNFEYWPCPSDKLNLSFSDKLDLSFSWIGSVRPGARFTPLCEMTSSGTMKFRISEITHPDVIPVYVLIQIKVSCYHDFIKSVTLEINNESFELSAGYQRLISGQRLSFILPYTDNDVTISVSFDPYIYNFDDYISEDGEDFQIVALSSFIIEVLGWWPKKG